MRIDNTLPGFNFNSIQAASGRALSAGSSPAEPAVSYYVPGIIVEISQQARDANNQNKIEETRGVSPAQEVEGCQTCRERKYVDGSDDSSVSYQSPTHIDPGEAAGKVMSHEREHVSHEQLKADREDRKVVSQTVSLSSSICPECGRIYISGGVTRTVTASDNKTEPVKNENNNAAGGQNE